jgi:hypothetical protein
MRYLFFWNLQNYPSIAVWDYTYINLNQHDLVTSVHGMPKPNTNKDSMQWYLHIQSALGRISGPTDSDNRK